MSKAKELTEQMFPEPQMENYEDILEYRNDRDWTIIARGAFIKGYEQAKEKMMKDAVIIEDELVMCYNNGIIMENRRTTTSVPDKNLVTSAIKLANELIEQLKQS